MSNQTPQRQGDHGGLTISAALAVAAFGCVGAALAFGAGFALGSTNGIPNRAARARRFAVSASSVSTGAVLSAATAGVGAVGAGAAFETGFAAAVASYVIEQSFSLGLVI